MESKKHLSFVELENPGRKTQVWEVTGYEDAFLGTVAWRSSWRQYVLNPAPHRDWSHDCLMEIAEFIKEQMDARK